MKEVLLNLIGFILAAYTLAFLFVFGIDAEAARIDRANGDTPTGCIFNYNCTEQEVKHNGAKTDRKEFAFLLSKRKGNSETTAKT